MDTQYLTALEYAQKHNRTKQWVISLCHSGRIDGAFKAGGVWAIPADTPLPAPLKPGPKLVFDPVKAKAAMDAAQQRRKDVEALEAGNVAQLGEMISEGLKQTISEHHAAGGIYDKAGNCKLGDRWIMPPDGWNGLAWRYYQSFVVGKVVDGALDPWPRNSQQRGRAYDIREGVHDNLTLEQIKAQVKHWGADEQAYYDSLVSGTINAI